MVSVEATLPELRAWSSSDSPADIPFLGLGYTFGGLVTVGAGGRFEPEPGLARDAMAEGRDAAAEPANPKGAGFTSSATTRN